MPPDTAPPLLIVDNLAAGYGRAAVLRDISLCVEAGSITALLGSNGVGKTTLMKAIAGLIAPTSGEIRLNGRIITACPPHERVAGGLALVPEGRMIFGDFSVEENLRLGAFVPRARNQTATRLDEMYGLFPRLAERRRQTARTLSGGEQQMLAIGRGLMSRPTLLLLDEPSIGLSPAMTRILFKLVEDVRASGVAVFIVEQNARTTLSIADYAYVVERGTVAMKGSGSQIAADPAIRTAYLGL